LNQSLLRSEGWHCFKNLHCVSALHVYFQWYRWFTRNFDRSCFRLVFSSMLLTVLSFVRTMFSAKNQIKSIPSEIGEMAMLQELSLSKWISGDALGTFGTLIGIDLDLLFAGVMLMMLFFVQIMFPANNQIESIPSEIGGMTMLEILYLCKWIWNVFSMLLLVMHLELLEPS
jgi:Leucine-rich repeat (LRR) protein